ncbi:E3 ubiquitin-protein ligase CHFR isoform X4 [Oryza brachyantha]|uniref:RING-type domain-containing protein n=1 Tax=Oryza brachyantha TaxID=4533 RepID=J3N6E3_ORYBR|nr:E3 ubiquitin-protein ligase CHFR isoform X4 [Oryza brachyantha]
MDAGECSSSQPCAPSPDASGGGVWAKLVPADSAFPEVELDEEDPVVCSRVTPAGGEEVAWCEIRRGADASSATIRNLSSDAIIVDGRIIQQEAVDIKPGSEIVPGPQKDGHLLYTFDITDLKDQDKNNIKIVLDIENAKCSICLTLWHDVVTVAPCLHNFCNGCFSEWLRRSSANSRDKSQSAACPQCRTAVQSVGRNHFLHNIEEAILQAFSSLQRSDEEIALLESYASVKTNIVLGKQRNQSRKRRLPRSNDEIDHTDRADSLCPQCGAEFGGFRCSPGAPHLPCNGCGGMMPARPNTTIPQKCLGCDRAFCGAYWCSLGVSSSQHNPICDQETFKMISQRHISSVPVTIHGGNQYEKDITERCIQQSGKALQAVISEWTVKFDNKELDRSRLQLNHVDEITSRTYVCNQCYNKFIDFLLYWFRVSMPRNLLPPDAANRDSCWYGFMCRTQHHRPDHAKKLNHVCRPTRGNP